MMYIFATIAKIMCQTKWSIDLMLALFDYVVYWKHILSHTFLVCLRDAQFLYRNFFDFSIFVLFAYFLYWYFQRTKSQSLSFRYGHSSIAGASKIYSKNHFIIWFFDVCWRFQYTNWYCVLENLTSLFVVVSKYQLITFNFQKKMVTVKLYHIC